MISTWMTKIQKALAKTYGASRAKTLCDEYQSYFSRSYQDENTIEMALHDVEHIEQLSDKQFLRLDLLWETKAKDQLLHVRLFQWAHPAPLADVLPMLENFDLRAINDQSQKIILKAEKTVWVSDITVTYPNEVKDEKKVRELFLEAFLDTYHGHAENDEFNKLVLGAGLTSRDIVILRAYAKYLRQVDFRYSQAYIAKALSSHSGIAAQLVLLFKMMHDPKANTKKQDSFKQIEERIALELEKVTSLDEDRIINRLLTLIKATLRTNYFQTFNDGSVKPYFSFKLNSRSIPELPLPVPLYEIFVYSPRFEGIHLRNSMVARGGIRWSNRVEDFRTEVLGLMKAQTVKNAVIVPSGAKGGFVLKAISQSADRALLQQEVVQCYQWFIKGLLDLTDNIVNNKFVRPKNVVCYDDIDTYLVVAADKGTATFSDIANQISKEYNFWLGDAFASGGSSGYDHKRMGITARGAWESIKRHFLELNIDASTAPLTVVGIGDMSGDVFGNGMLYSKHIQLVAAFDHRDIFIDPNPHPEASYKERQRLFRLPLSSWQNYNKKCISKGGGVFSRALKSITITPQMKKVLGITDHSLTPNDLVKAILKAPVDLLYNGGIGTYVKSPYENNSDVGDRANDYCRVNGDDLRVKVVGEGGNLGFTQLGRVSFALTGGLINTDFIDNSGGVDCSDHEVNLKILLDKEVNSGKFSLEKRDELLVSVTKEVAALVLEDNYNQALAMSITAFYAKRNIGLHQAYLKELETAGIVNRAVEYLPDDKTLVERKNAGLGLTRPELAVLLAYTKIHIKQAVLESNLPEDPYLVTVLESAFPQSIRSKYKNQMREHRLHRDIIATQLSSHLVNQMGITFVYRLQIEMGATIDEIVRAHTVASSIFDINTLQKLIESLSLKVPMTAQYEMFFNVHNLISIAVRWFLHSRHLMEDLESVVHHYKEGVKVLEEKVPDLMGGFAKGYLGQLSEEFIKAGLSRKDARRIATYRAIYTALNIIEVATQHNFDLIQTAEVYFACGERIQLLWFRDQIANDTREGHWNILARLTLRDELDVSQRALTVSIMKGSRKGITSKMLIDRWMATNQRALNRWDRLLSMLYSSGTLDYTMFFISIRELLGLILNSQPATD